MAGRGPTPKTKDSRNRRNQPARGDWQESDSDGWQHGAMPPAPDGLMAASLEAWSTWMASWFAAHWLPSDLPGLRQLVRLYDQVERGEFQRAGELRLQMDTYGITPKGQQDRHWVAPKAAEPKPAATGTNGSARYGHLSTVK